MAGRIPCSRQPRQPQRRLVTPTAELKWKSTSEPQAESRAEHRTVTLSDGTGPGPAGRQPDSHGPSWPQCAIIMIAGPDGRGSDGG